MRRHIRRAHSAEGSDVAFSCGICSSAFVTKEELLQHREDDHIQNHDFEELEAAHFGQCRLLRAYIPKEKSETLDTTLIYIYHDMCRLVEAVMTSSAYFKINFTLSVDMYRLDSWGEVSQMENFPFRSFGFTVVRESDFRQDLQMTIGDFERNVSY